MKTLVIFGSPRKKGDSAFLAETLISELDGTIIRLSAYHDEISPCIDCRHCTTNLDCAITDDMELIYDDDFDNIVVASPVHMGSLTGPMVSLLSRFQTHFTASRFQGTKIEVKPKGSALILTGGGKGAPDNALRLGKMIIRHIGGTLTEDNTIMSLNTDEVTASNDEAAIAKVREVARRLNAGQ